MKSCWTPQLSMNLALHNELMSIPERCERRFVSLDLAQAACESAGLAACGGITRDGGLQCDGQLRQYEMRTNREIHNNNAASWLPTPRNQDGTCSREALRAFASKAAHERRGMVARAGVAPTSRAASGAAPASRAEVATQLRLREVEPHDRAASSRWCVGPCCDTPLHRNRTCAFRDLLYVAGKGFLYLSDEPGLAPSSHATFLHNRFADGDTTGKNQRSYFAPQIAPTALAKGVTRVVESPLYIGADVHSNIAHLMLDSVFPSTISLLRLQATAAAYGRNISVRANPQSRLFFLRPRSLLGA